MIVILAFAFGVMLTAVLNKLLNKPKYNGVMRITEKNGTMTFGMEFDGDPYVIKDLAEVRFKVQRGSIVPAPPPKKSDSMYRG